MIAARHAQRLLHVTVRHPAASSGQTAAAELSTPACSSQLTARCSSPGGQQSVQCVPFVSSAAEPNLQMPAARQSDAVSNKPALSAERGLRWQHSQLRGFAALADPWIDEEAHGSHPQPPQPAQHMQHRQPAPSQHSSPRHLPPQLPSVEEVRQRLRGGSGGAGCSSAGAPPQRAQPPAADGGTLDWQRLVEALRRGQETLPEPQDVLTDTFQ